MASQFAGVRYPDATAAVPHGRLRCWFCPWLSSLVPVVYHAQATDPNTSSRPQVFVIFTILPHELGHAGMARLVGMRVFQIYVGSGKTLFRANLFGFPVEFKAVPIGGLAIAAYPKLESIRLRRFAFAMAGPAANLLLGAAILPFLDPTCSLLLRAEAALRQSAKPAA